VDRSAVIIDNKRTTLEADKKASANDEKSLKDSLDDRAATDKKNDQKKPAVQEKPQAKKKKHEASFGGDEESGADKKWIQQSLSKEEPLPDDKCSRESLGHEEASPTGEDSTEEASPVDQSCIEKSQIGDEVSAMDEDRSEPTGERPNEDEQGTSSNDVMLSSQPVASLPLSRRPTPSKRKLRASSKLSLSRSKRSRSSTMDLSVLETSKDEQVTMF
jgi:hypothetical protein